MPITFNEKAITISWKAMGFNGKAASLNGEGTTLNSLVTKTHYLPERLKSEAEEHGHLTEIAIRPMDWHDGRLSAAFHCIERGIFRG